MPPIQFSSIFANRRKELKLTQEDVAQFVGVSRAAVSKWEQGLSYPDITLLPKLAMLLDLTIDSLLGYQPQLTAKRSPSCTASWRSGLRRRIRSGGRSDSAAHQGVLQLLSLPLEDGPAVSELPAPVPRSAGNGRHHPPALQPCQAAQRRYVSDQ